VRAPVMADQMRVIIVGPAPGATPA